MRYKIFYLCFKYLIVKFCAKILKIVYCRPILRKDYITIEQENRFFWLARSESFLKISSNFNNLLISLVNISRPFFGELHSITADIRHGHDKTSSRLLQVFQLVLYGSCFCRVLLIKRFAKREQDTMIN